jgi:hypothetical protein
LLSAYPLLQPERQKVRPVVQSPVVRWGTWTGLGLGRAALAEEHGQHDDRADGEELALPVLERLEPELGGTDELPRADAGLAVRVLLGRVLPGAGDGMADEGRRRTSATR